MVAKDASTKGRRIICQNRRARHDYAIGEHLEVGMVLRGSEVKALREGHAHLSEAWVQVINGEAFLVGGNIAEYRQASHFNHPPERTRKLLMHRRQIDKLEVEIRQKGQVAIPLLLYFNEAGRVKLEIGIGKGKSREDRREAIKEREVKRELARVLVRRR
jgi:SsrA-binding protein